MKCPKCGEEFNAGKLMGAVRSEKKTAAAKKRGEQLAKDWANARKVKAEVFGGAARKDVQTQSDDTLTSHRAGVGLPSGNPEPVSSPAPTAILRPEVGLVMPKGSLSLEDMRQMLKAGGRIGGAPQGAKEDVPMHEIAHAPFDCNLEGEPHRVTTLGKKLGLYYTGGGEAVFCRSLAPGELEAFWAKRIIK